MLAPAAAEAAWLPGWGSSDGTPGVDDSWCFGANYKLYVGDFDGNGHSDVMCHNSSSGQRRLDFQYSTYRGLWGTNWDSYTDGGAIDDWCSESGTEILVGDYNGDGRDDLLCRVRAGYTNPGRKQIDFADANGHLDGSDFDTLDYPEAAQSWCTNSGESVFVGDFNGDGKDDLLCRVAAGYANAGRKRVDYANGSGSFYGTEWDTLGTGGVEQTWCIAAGESVFVGDFNGDGKDDLLCHMALGYTDAGRRRVDWAGSGTTLFAGTDWSSADGGGAAASWCATTGDVLKIADVDGDGKEDLVCVNEIDGGYASRVDHASNSGSFYGTNGQTHEEDWCLDSDEDVHVGDFDGDGQGDTLCHDDTTGYRAIRYANINGDFYSVCSEGSAVGDGALPHLPVHFAVVTDPGNTDVTMRQTHMPTANSTHVHPMNGGLIDTPTEYFVAEVEVMNAYTDTYDPTEAGVSVGDDYIIYEYESHTLYDDIEGNTSCTYLLNWGNTASVEYSANCWESNAVLDEACYPNYCDGPYQDAGDAWNFGFGCAIEMCEDPKVHKPHTLNVMVMDRCAWDDANPGIDDSTCGLTTKSMSFGFGGSRFFTAWDYERMLRGTDGTLPRIGASAVEQHELGHVLGLAHTGDCGHSGNAMDYENCDDLSQLSDPNANPLWRGEGYTDAIHELDSNGNPVMAYTDQIEDMVTAARAKVVEWSCN